MISLIPQVFVSCEKMSDENCDPLSVVIVAGMPYVCTQPWEKASTTDSAVMSFIGTAMGHLVNLSTAVSRYR